jgi:hypothetical protein
MLGPQPHADEHANWRHHIALASCSATTRSVRGNIGSDLKAVD